MVTLLYRMKTVIKNKKLIYALSICTLFLFIFCALVSIYYKRKVLKITSCMVTSMTQVELCSTNSGYVNLQFIPSYLMHAIIVSEDARFYTHNGFDLKEIKNSIKTNVEKKKLYRGGSTITQQLVKNVFLSKDKSIIRKLKEAMMTYHIEKILSKEQILEKYINVVQFGEKIYGIKQASQHYFGKHPLYLSLTESVFLAHILPNPILYSEGFNKKELTEFNTERMHDILLKLFKYNKIDELEFDHATNKIKNLTL